MGSWGTGSFPQCLAVREILTFLKVRTFPVMAFKKLLSLHIIKYYKVLVLLVLSIAFFDIYAKVRGWIYC